MSILIKGVEMPTSCMLCPLCVEEADPANGEMCMVTGTLMQPCTRERVDNCPLVPVPPHGRLIDADYQKQTLCAECTLYPDKCLEYTGGECDWHSIAHLRMCPTIIEAEEGE